MQMQKVLAMIIRKKSITSGKIHEMDLDITENQLKNYNAGMLVQNAFPNLTPTEREFLITGMSEKEQREFFGA